MRAVQIALLVVCIQIMGGIITTTGLFGSMYYESSISSPSWYGTSATAQTAEEQQALSFNIMSSMWNILTWGWIKYYFEPLYSNVPSVKSIIDALILGLNGLSAYLIGISFLQFLRNLIQPLRGA